MPASAASDTVERVLFLVLLAALLWFLPPIGAAGWCGLGLLFVAGMAYSEKLRKSCLVAVATVVLQGWYVVRKMLRVSRTTATPAAPGTPGTPGTPRPARA